MAIYRDGKGVGKAGNAGSVYVNNELLWRGCSAGMPEECRKDVNANGAQKVSTETKLTSWWKRCSVYIFKICSL